MNAANAAIAHDLRVYARRRWPLENDKYRKLRLADLLGISARRVKSLYEAELTAVIRQHEAEAVRRLLGQQQIEEANRVELEDLKSRIARLEAALVEAVPELPRHAVEERRQGLRDRRGSDGAWR